MKTFLYYFNLFIDESYKETKNKLYLPPVILAAIISGAVTIGSKIIADIKAKKAAKKADAEAAIEKDEVSKESKQGVEVSKGIAREGDPTLAIKKRNIQESAADATGKVVASSGSTQEIINAVQGIQSTKDKSNLIAETQASQFKLNAKKELSQRFTAAGQLKLAGNAAVDQRLQRALEAIGSNAQAGVDTAQSFGGQLIQAASFLNNDKKGTNG